MTDEEKAKQPIPEEELLLMPKIVPENRRCACPDTDCNYVTVDAFMLVAHMQHIHPEFKEVYSCPHCPTDIAVPFNDLEFHLRCHGDLLFKVCCSSIWAKCAIWLYRVELMKNDGPKNANLMSKMAQNVQF